jgi:hypothetical protein
MMLSTKYNHLDDLGEAQGRHSAKMSWVQIDVLLAQIYRAIWRALA